MSFGSTDILIQEYYQYSIQTVINDYHLSDDNTSDPEVYYGRIDGQDSVCWSLIDDLKHNINNEEVVLELDAILRKNKIDITKDGKDYKLLYKNLLEVKIDVCLKQVELFKTGSFTPNEYDKSLDTIEIEKPVGKGREERPSTYNKRTIINNIAKRMREKSPYVSKEIIAQDVANELSIKHSIKLSWKTVYRDYSDEL